MFKLNLYHFLILFAIVFVFYGCAVLGTKTIYRTDNVQNINKIGYCELYDNEILTSIFSQTNNVFHSAITEIITKYGLPAPTKIGFIIREDKKSISDFCEQNNIDALLYTNLRFIRSSYSVYFIPVTSNLDTEVKMRLYSRQGDLLFSTTHNTYAGNSYMMPPSPYTTVHDGVKGAFKRIAKEMHLKTVK